MDYEKFGNPKEIELDFYDKKTVVVNAKQYDKLSRYILVTCKNQGSIFSLNAGIHSAFVRYRKADEYAVFNRCEILEDGRILVELTEQMLAAEGNCIGDLVIISNNELATSGGIPIITGDGEVIQVTKHGIISTMKFCVDVVSTPFSNSEIESSDEFSALNELMDKVLEDYSYIMDASNKGLEEMAEYARQAKESQTQAKDSETKSKQSETNSKKSEENSKKSETTTKQYLDEVREIRENINEEVVLAAQTEIRDKYIPEIQGYVAESGKSRDASAQSEANAQVYESSTEHYYELTRQLSIANVGDITFSLNAERNCMTATFMDDSGEEDIHDWYVRFLKFLEEYANKTKEQLTAAQGYAGQALESKNAAAKSLADAQGVKTQCDNVLTQTQKVKTDAETSCNSILDETTAIKDEAVVAEGNSRTAANQAAVAKDQASVFASNAQKYFEQTQQLSIANVGEMKFAIDPIRNCVVVIYTDSALVDNISRPLTTENGDIMQISGLL